MTIKKKVTIALLALALNPCLAWSQSDQKRDPQKIPVVINDAANKRFAEATLLLSVDMIYGGASGGGGWVLKEAKSIGASGIAPATNGKKAASLALPFGPVLTTEIAKERLLFPVTGGTLTLWWKSGKPTNKDAFEIPYNEALSSSSEKLEPSKTKANGGIKLVVEATKKPLQFFMQFKGQGVDSVGFLAPQP